MATCKTDVDAYSVSHMIGKGTFGEVYKAEHKHTKELVAVKIINLKQCAKKDKDHMFQEITMLHRCHHDNLVQYKNSFDKGQYLYIVMELCTEGNLRDYIQAHNGLNENMCILVLRQVSSGIDYLHKQEIVHRDVKTTNIFITEQNGKMCAKIGDFGLARSLDVPAVPTLNVGSPYFMSPEMIDGKPYDKSTDIWSLGCSAFEMVTTNIPFEASKMASLKQKIIKGEVVIENGQYCEEIKRLIQSMMSQDPEKRPNVTTILKSLSSHNHCTESSVRAVSGQKHRRYKPSLSKSWGAGRRKSFDSVQDASSGYDTSTGGQAEAEAEADASISVPVKVKLSEKDADIYKKAKMFEKDVRKYICANTDVVMKQINEAIKKTKQMDNCNMFMSEVKNILDVDTFESCELDLQSLWLFKRKLLLKHFDIDW